MNIIILGTGGSIIHCDFKADEVWGVNGSWTVKNCMPEQHKSKYFMNKCFMADYLWSSEGVMNFDPITYNKLFEADKTELFTLHPHTIGKHKMVAKLIPYKAMVDYFDTDYFTDTITYMIAYALYKYSYYAKNPEGIVRPELSQPLSLRFFGVDMCTTLEYQVSKGGIEYWLGIARGMGAEIEIAFGSAIMANPRGIPYGWRPKIDYAKIDPFNILGKKKTKRQLTGSDKIKLIMRGSPNEENYTDEGGE